VLLCNSPVESHRRANLLINREPNVARRHKDIARARTTVTHRKEVLPHGTTHLPCFFLNEVVVASKRIGSIVTWSQVFSSNNLVLPSHFVWFDLVSVNDGDSIEFGVGNVVLQLNFKHALASWASRVLGDT